MHNLVKSKEHVTSILTMLVGIDDRPWASNASGGQDWLTHSAPNGKAEAAALVSRLCLGISALRGPFLR